jgi:predicted transcriptional regulator
MARTACLNVRVNPELKARLEKLARKDRRSLSALVELLLERAIKPNRMRRSGH